ncbi:MAG TPA: DUF5946 family protein [Pirellula sp.]|nr:DUF5946 family protein [Pirellula sp.]
MHEGLSHVAKTKVKRERVRQFVCRGYPFEYVVAACGAQEASPQDKPIRLVSSLIGLYLHVERGFSGREIQLAYMKLGRRKQAWPKLSIPVNRSTINAETVLKAPIQERDSRIHEWCCSVWQAFVSHRDAIKRLLAYQEITDAQSIPKYSRSRI